MILQQKQFRYALLVFSKAGARSIFITIRREEAMLMIIFPEASKTRFYINLDTTEQRLFNIEGREKNLKTLMHTFYHHHRGTPGRVFFILNFGC